jgi:hypothetical protein
MAEILDLLQRVDLLLREKVSERVYGVVDYNKQMAFADARELLQKAVTKRICYKAGFMTLPILV